MPIGMMGRKSYQQKKISIHSFVWAVSLYVAETCKTSIKSSKRKLPIVPSGIAGHGFVGQPLSKQSSWLRYVFQRHRGKQQKQIYLCFLCQFLLFNTVNLNQSTPNSFYPRCQSALSPTLLRFSGTTFVETAGYLCSVPRTAPRTTPRTRTSGRERLERSISRGCIATRRRENSRWRLKIPC